jgi:Na+:H+ antiporter, NhaA family
VTVDGGYVGVVEWTPNAETRSETVPRGRPTHLAATRRLAPAITNLTQRPSQAAGRVACGAPGSLVGINFQHWTPHLPRVPRRATSAALAPSRALREFLATESAGGVLLLVATATALVWANSPWQDSYDTLWHTSARIGIGGHELDLDLQHWVNDGLMALFFLVVGLEVKRELLLGELRDRRAAMLPVFAAIGGMVVPALLFFALNPSGQQAGGWGIPMATDIAFALGVLALVARSIPPAVRLFLLTLAIVDDIGAIVVIAVFYSAGIEAQWLAVAAMIVATVMVLRRAAFVATPLFMILGVALWAAMHASGIHATLAGVTMGLLVPATPTLTREIVRSRTDELLDVFSPEAARETTRIARQSVSQLEWLEHELHPWTSFVIVPVFALANAGVPLSADAIADAAGSTVTLGVILGLVLGKTVGIAGAAWIAIRLGIADLPGGVKWRQLLGAAALGGIGFTVSLFIAGLAFESVELVDDAKIGILAASAIATGLGALLLHTSNVEPIIEGSPALSGDPPLDPDRGF